MRCSSYWHLVLLLVPLIAGCSSNNSLDEIAVPSGHLPTSVQSLTCDDPGSDVAIYYDATPNMAGFLHDGRYVELVTMELDGARPSGSSARRYRVATRLEDGMLEVGSHSEPSTREFYALGDTELTLIADTASVEEVSVIVTNLFQTDADINRVAGTISEKFFQEGLAVGVAATKYSFRGTIYDIGLHYGRQWYEGSRPLYVMALGDHCAVADYVDRLSDYFTEESHYLILSPYLVEQPVSFDAIESTENLFQVALPGLPQDEFTRQVAIRNEQAPASFNATLEVKPAPYSLFSSLQDVDVNISCVDASGNACGSRDAGALSARLGHADGKDQLHVDIDPTGLGSTVYRYDIDFVPSSLRLPDFVYDWNIDIAEIEPGQFPGEKTQNLRRFVSQLRNEVDGRHNPRPGHLRIYINNE